MHPLSWAAIQSGMEGCPASDADDSYAADAVVADFAFAVVAEADIVLCCPATCDGQRKWETERDRAGVLLRPWLREVISLVGDYCLSCAGIGLRIAVGLIGPIGSFYWSISSGLLDLSMQGYALIVTPVALIKRKGEATICGHDWTGGTSIVEG